MAEAIYRLDGQYRYVELKLDDGPPITYQVTVGQNQATNVSALYWDMTIDSNIDKEVKILANFYSQLGFALERLTAGTRTLAQTRSDIGVLLAAVDTGFNT
jgi:hypothetical protein